MRPDRKVVTQVIQNERVRNAQTRFSKQLCGKRINSFAYSNKWHTQICSNARPKTYLEASNLSASEPGKFQRNSFSFALMLMCTLFSCSTLGCARKRRPAAALACESFS